MVLLRPSPYRFDDCVLIPVDAIVEIARHLAVKLAIRTTGHRPTVLLPVVVGG
jgi:hypothetical protein